MIFDSYVKFLSVWTINRILAWYSNLENLLRKRKRNEREKIRQNTWKSKRDEDVW